MTKASKSGVVLDVFRDLVRQMDSVLLERTEVIQAMVCALLAQEHVLLLGPPGTAKSLLARTLADAMDRDCFEILMGKFTTPEEVFGPVSVAGLQQDKYERVGAGKLQESRYGFVDEIWKANSAILNSLLTIVNERLYHDGTRGPVNVPLQMLVGASNELPQDESLGALYDRFLVRYEVKPLRDDIAFAKLLRSNGSMGTVTPLPDGALDQARSEVDSVKVGLRLAKTLAELRRAIGQKGMYVSDRRWKQAVGYLKAVAWMDARGAIEDDHLVALADCLWEEPSQRGVVLQAVMQVSNPVGLKALELIDAATEAYESRGDDQASIITSGQRVRQALDEVTKLDQDNPRVAEATAQIGTLREQLVSELSSLV